MTDKLENIYVEVVCHQCGSQLDTIVSVDDDGDNVIRVKPCDTCIERVHDFYTDGQW